MVVEEVGDALTWISNFDKKLNNALSNLANADSDGQFTSMEFPPTVQTQLCRN